MKRQGVAITLTEVQKEREGRRELIRKSEEVAQLAHRVAKSGSWTSEISVPMYKDRPVHGPKTTVRLTGTEFVPVDEGRSVAVRRHYSAEHHHLTGLFLRNGDQNAEDQPELLVSFWANGLEMTGLGKPDLTQLKWVEGWLEYIEAKDQK